MRRWVLVTLLSTVVASAISALVVLTLPRLVPEWFPIAPVIAAQKSQTSAGGSQNAKPASTDKPADDHGSAGLGRSTEAMPQPDPWLATLVGKVAWPLSLLLALLLIAWNSRLRRLFGAGSRLVRKIRAGGIEMEISSEAVDEVRQQLRGSFRELVGNARDEYERMADLQDLDRRLAAVIEQEVMPNFSNPRPADLRATLHVRDIIFRDYLYQLVDYYPKGGGAHRRFSQRYGIIGRSWRSRKSHGTGNAFGTYASEESLVEEWGMTADEAHGMLNSKPSCLSVILRSGGIETGILYMDSSSQNAFGRDAEAQSFVENLEKKPLVVELGAAVERALAPLRTAAPNFDLKELG